MVAWLAAGLQVEHGFGAAWHLQQVEVLNKKTGAKALFRCGEGEGAAAMLVRSRSAEHQHSLQRRLTQGCYWGCVVQGAV